jgi:hypothetical protein
MVSEDLFYENVVQYQGPIDLKALYETMFDKVRALDYSLYEKAYRKVVRSGVTDIFYNWECTRPVNTYVLFKIDISHAFYATKEVEVVENGNRVQRTQGVFKVTFKPKLVLDWKDEWSKPAFKKRMREWYDRFIYGRKPFKPPANPITHAFGQYYQWLLKLDEHTKLFMNTMREFYDLTPITGIKEI